MKTNYLFIGTLLLLASCGNKMLKEAEKAYGNEQFSTAAKIYENVVKENADATTMLHLADCYRQMDRHEEAEKWYSKSIHSPEAKSIDKLHYAQVLREEGKYNDAASMYDAYLVTNPNDVAAKNQRSACAAPQSFQKTNPFYIVQKVDLGFVGSCFSPTKIGNDLMVTAATTPKPGAPVDYRSGNSYFDLYTLAHSEQPPVSGIANGTDGNYDAHSLTPLIGDVNSNLHEGPAVVSSLNNILYFTRSSKVKNTAARAIDNDNHLEICTAEFVNGKWSNIQSLPFNNKEYSVGHPAITANGTRLYFISDMPGGLGGTDIYYSDLINGVWSAPVNAGNTINTNGNEMFPTIRVVNAGKEEFFFSSDGWEGVGGLDLFRCEMKNGIPENPQRLDAPFNSSNDDFGMLFNADGKSGYFSSNRGSENGKDDIYSFTRRDPKFYVKLTVMEKGSNVPFKQTKVQVQTNKENGKEFEITTDDMGSVIFPADSLTNYNFCMRNKDVFTCYAGVVTGGFKGAFSDTSFATLNVEKIVINKPIRIENIYYDYNKWNIRPDAALELDKMVKVMVENPQITIELSSHTDSRGSDKYNMTLSQKRAQAAVDYIVSKGISKDRITAKGYGESKPLNRCVNGVQCTEEEWQFNRRTEFKVTKIN